MTVEALNKQDAYDSERVGIIVATRGRPKRFLQMLKKTTANLADASLVSMWCRLDEDDPTAPKLMELVRRQQPKISMHWIVGPRCSTLGQAYNEAAAKAAEVSGIIQGFVDDYAIETPGWDQVLRQAFQSLEKRIGLFYLPDPTATEGQITLMAISREWLEAVGSFVPEYFPFWFNDSWLDEVSSVAEMKHPVDIKVNTLGEKGSTMRMWNLPFWYKFYHLGRLERLEKALYLAAAEGDADKVARISALFKQTVSEPLSVELQPIDLVDMELGHTAEFIAPSRSYLEAEYVANEKMFEWSHRYPAVFQGLEVVHFDVDLAMRCKGDGQNLSSEQKTAVCNALISGEPFGSVAQITGIDLVVLLQWRNAAAIHYYRNGL